MFKVKSVQFISESDRLNSDTFHRCCLISEEINKINYSSNVLTGNLIFKKVPNIYLNWINWKKLIKKSLISLCYIDLQI